MNTSRVASRGPIRGVRKLSGVLRAGQTVEVSADGYTMSGIVLGFAGSLIDVRVPADELLPALRTSGLDGTMEISVGTEAAQAPVVCWLADDVVRMQVAGSVGFVQRRQHPRRELDVPVQMSWRKQRTQEWARVSGRTRDISVGGMRVGPASVLWPERGGVIGVHLDLPGAAGPVQLDAEVIGKTPDYGLRVRFTGIPAELVRQIGAYVDAASADRPAEGS